MFNFGQQFNVRVVNWDNHFWAVGPFEYSEAMRQAGRAISPKSVHVVEVIGVEDRQSYATLYGKVA
jgi:hypothetical protein